MQVNGHHFGLGLVLAVPLILGLVGEGQAAPGDIEINQAGAMAGGITAGDLPGFPVDLNEAGNFVLTSPLDLTVYLCGVGDRRRPREDEEEPDRDRDSQPGRRRFGPPPTGEDHQPADREDR